MTHRYDKYEVQIYWSAEDQIFIGEVPDLPGCMTHGRTRDVCLKNVEEAIELWVETSEEFGDPIPEPRFRQQMIA